MAAASSPMASAVGEKPHNIADVIRGNPKQSYASQLQQKQAAATIPKLDLCPVNFVHGEPVVEFTMDEINDFTREEGLHQAVVMKFSYGKPDLQEIRRVFSSQFDVQGRCNIGQLEFRHLLVRFDLYSDYVKFLSRSTGYLKAKGEEYFFRSFPWTFQFNPKEETSMAVVWISLPGLPPNLFAKRSLLSIASAVGKALAVDKATQEKTRPSTARVKVLLDLLDEHPNKVKLRIVDKVTGKSIVYYQEIVYDNLPKYCCCCKHQGHDERTCRILKRKTGEDVVATVEQLKGDARDFLNAKRAAQGVVEITEKNHNNNTQKLMQIVEDSPAGNSVAGLALNSILVTAATGKNEAVDLLNPVFDATVEVQDDERRMLKNPADIPASTVFARMFTATADVQNNAADRHIAVGQPVNIADNMVLDGRPNVEKINVDVVTEQLTNAEERNVQKELHKPAQHEQLTLPSNVPNLKGASHFLESKNSGQEAITGAYKDGINIDDGKIDHPTKKGEVWNVFSSRKSLKNKAASTGDLSPGTRRNTLGFVDNSNLFAPLELDEDEVATQSKNRMSKKLVPVASNENEALDNEMEANELGVRGNVSQKELEEEMTRNSSNVPTLCFSTPHVENIIKEAQAAMMMHTNMAGQPLVTLNTSDIEIPSQSERSFGKDEVESKQMLLSTGLDIEQQDGYVLNWLARTKTWADQVEHDEEEDWVNDNDVESNDSDERESDDEELRSVASPPLTSNQKSKSNLNLNAPAFIPRKSAVNIIAVTGQQKQQIPPSNNVISAASSGQQKQQVSHRNVAISPALTGQIQQHSSPANSPVQTGQKQQEQCTNSPLISVKSHGQQCATGPLISLEDRRLLDALVSPNPLFSLPTVEVNRGQEGEQNRAMTVTTTPQDTVVVSQHFEQTLPQQVNVRRDIYEEGEEDELLQKCILDAAKRGDLSPMHIGKNKKSHSRKKSWDGKMSEEIRRLPMRVAKQRKAAPTTSTRSTRSQKKT